MSERIAHVFRVLFLAIIALSVLFPLQFSCAQEELKKMPDAKADSLEVLIVEREELGFLYLQVFSGPETLPQLLIREESRKVTDFMFCNKEIRPRDVKCLVSLSHIKAMRFWCDEFDNEDARALAFFPKLTILSLEGDAKLTDDTMLELGKLNLEYFICSSQIRGSQAEKLSSLKQLRSLVLSNSDNKGEELSHISVSATLEMLSLSGTKFDARALTALSKCPSLKSLTLSGDWTETPWKAISTIKSLKRITFLDDKLNGEGMVHLTQLPELEELCITSDHFVLSHLAQLERCPKLRYLGVMCLDNEVGPLYPHLLKIKSLRKVNIMTGGKFLEATEAFEQELERRVEEDREKGILPPEDE
jgi:hypothetical protein